MSIQHEQRGTVKEIILVTHYPDNSIKVGHLNAKGIKSIIFNHDAIIEHVGEAGDVINTQWNTGDWKNNPSVLIISDKNRYGNCGWYCKHAGHIEQFIEDLDPVYHNESESEAAEIRRNIEVLEKKLKAITG
jgi:hypothetical protein